MYFLIILLAKGNNPALKYIWCLQRMNHHSFLFFPCCHGVDHSKRCALDPLGYEGLVLYLGGFALGLLEGQEAKVATGQSGPMVESPNEEWVLQALNVSLLK